MLPPLWTLHRDWKQEVLENNSGKASENATDAQISANQTDRTVPSQENTSNAAQPDNSAQNADTPAQQGEKARLYCIWYQDGGGKWIEQNLPEIIIYESGAPETGYIALYQKGGERYVGGL